MADGAYPVMIAGGLVAILSAGIPILFLSGKGEQEDKATRAANLERGLRSEMGDDAFEEAMMEEVEIIEEDVPPTEGKQRGSI